MRLRSQSLRHDAHPAYRDDLRCRRTATHGTARRIRPRATRRRQPGATILGMIPDPGPVIAKWCNHDPVGEFNESDLMRTVPGAAAILAASVRGTNEGERDARAAREIVRKPASASCINQEISRAQDIGLWTVTIRPRGTRRLGTHRLGTRSRVAPHPVRPPGVGTDLCVCPPGVCAFHRGSGVAANCIRPSDRKPMHAIHPSATPGRSRVISKAQNVAVGTVTTRPGGYPVCPPGVCSHRSAFDVGANCIRHADRAHQPAAAAGYPLAGRRFHPATAGGLFRGSRRRLRPGTTRAHRWLRA
jgi:hypothetical protein